MPPEDWRQIQAHFEGALELRPEDRATFLAHLAATQPAIAEEVRSLLAAHEQSHRLIDAPRQEQLPKGMRVGPYAIDSLIGTGGMSAVYLGHRVDGQFDKQVAIKLITGLAESIDDARSRSERQILASLEHPNIARLIDSGVNEFGQSYLVMEWVQGQPLDVWRATASPDQRLDVWLQLAAAVSHAHRSLVVHRDLKPSNILVTSTGEAKLLDFGIAKLLEAGGAATVTQTMTPRYASPEQVAGQPATTATDVYSLGILLLELVADVHPHARDTQTAHELATAVLRDEPRIPSTVPADLAAVIAMALRKDPLRRYPTVDQFADDVRRFRKHLPVTARPEHLGYTLTRFVQRNKVATAGAALLLIAITVGVATTLWQARRANRRFEEVRSLAKYLVFDFNDAIQKLPGSTELQKTVVEQSLGYLDRLSREAGGDTNLRLEVAEGYLRLGDVLGNPFMPNLGNTPKAVESYDKGLAIAGDVWRANPSNIRARRSVADLKQQRGSSSGFHGTSADAERELREALQMRRELAAQFKDDADEQLKLARVLNALGTRLGQRGGSQIESTEGQQYQNESLAVVDASLKTWPSHPGLLRQKIQAVYAVGLNQATTNPTEALARFAEAIAWHEKLTPADRETINARRQRASVLLSAGWSHGQTNAFADGIREYDEAAKILENIALNDPANMAAQYHLTAAYRGRGIVCEYAGNLPCAVENFERAAAIHAALSAKDPASTIYPGLRGELLARAGRHYLTMKNEAKARERSKAGLDVLSELADRPRTEAPQLVEACKALAMVPIPDLRDLNRASGYCRRAKELSGGKDSYVLEIYASVRGELGDRAGAVALVKEALALLPEPKPGEPMPLRRKTLLEVMAKYQ
jgi:tetratricopeptide (TPR) repeat protein